MITYNVYNALPDTTMKSAGGKQLLLGQFLEKARTVWCEDKALIVDLQPGDGSRYRWMLSCLGVKAAFFDLINLRRVLCPYQYLRPDELRNYGMATTASYLIADLFDALNGSTTGKYYDWDMARPIEEKEED